MADNGEGAGGKEGPSIAELRNQVLTIVTRKFEGTVEKPIDQVVLKVLSRRRKKWRKRHHLAVSDGKKLRGANLELFRTCSICAYHYYRFPNESVAVSSGSAASYRSPDPALREEKELITDNFYQSGERLLQCRRKSYAQVRQLEREKRELQLQSRKSHLQTLARLQQSLTVPTTDPNPTRTEAEPDVQILKDLQLALSQAEALAKVRQMKLTMTPRPPPVHRRHSSTGNLTHDQFGLSLLSSPAPSSLTSTTNTLGSTAVTGTSANSSLPVELHSTACPLPRTTLQNSRGGQSSVSEASADHEGSGTRVCVELEPVDMEEQSNFYEDLENLSSENLPRIACVMSLTEGQDTASVVEVMAENDTVIETHSSLEQEEVGELVAVNHSQSHNISIEERLDPESALPLVPEKEEIVSTTPENTTTQQNTASTDEELLEMIMKDREITAWISKARLRPRPPSTHNDSRVKRRSHSKS